MGDELGGILVAGAPAGSIDSAGAGGVTVDALAGPGPAVFGPAALGAVVVAMIVAAFVRQGAFYPVDAFGITVVSVPVVLLGLRRRLDRHTLLVALALVTLAGWWLARALMEHDAAAFLPLGTSVLGFLAAFVVVGALGDLERRRVGYAVAAVGSATAAVGVGAVLLRWTPLAARVDGVWRAATTLTYPAAAGTLFVIAVLVVLGLGNDGWTGRVALCLCMAGLVAARSPWDLLALGAGAALVPRRRLAPALWPLLAGVGAGAVTMAAGTGRAAPWWAWPAVVGAVALAGTGAPGPGRRLWRRPIVVGAGALVLVALTVGLVLHGPAAGSARPAPRQDRFLTWSAAVDEWRSSELTGVGPERVYNSRVPVSTYPGFEPDSYLTVTADGGLVAAVLLLGAGAALFFAVRRHDLLSSCAAGALVAFVVAGNIDFDWQLPALGLIGGCLAGLASPLGRPPPPRRHPAESTRRALRTARAWSKPGWIVLAVAVVVVEMVVGDSHIASAGVRTENLTPPPSLTPATPARIILRGPDATDPFMVHVGRHYYLYASEGDFGASAYDLNVPVWVSTTVGHWQKPRDVLPVLPAWASFGATWAPDVRHVKGGWALYFSAVLKGVRPETHCIGDAFATGPLGPFVAEPAPMICQRDHRGSIDARTFVDTNGELIMYWKSEDNANPRFPGPDQNGRTGIWAQRLSPNGKVLLGEPVEIYQPDQAWEGTIVEAPDVIDVWGTYWLFFSGNWYNNPGYGIGVAACQGPFGPCTDPTPVPFLGSNAQGSGPGEPSVWNDGDNIYLLYNPWRSDDPMATPPRPVAMARIGFRSNGPYLATP